MKNNQYTHIEDAFVNFNSLYGEDLPSQRERYTKAFNNFKSKYSTDFAYIASSSGRVEVIGNHTDHNGGLVICSSISLDSLAMFLPTEDGIISICSEGYKEFSINVNNFINTHKEDSESLVKGVVAGFIKKGYKVGGFKATVTSNVLGGAGISSSASFELLIAEILNFLYNNSEISCEEKSYIAQYAEQEYFNKPCGLMDQSAIAYGGLNEIDFSNKNKIKVNKINNKIKDFTFVLINTESSHANLTEHYAAIPSEMKKVAKFFNKERLIEISENEFYNSIQELQKSLTDREILRAIHFFEENKRVKRAVEALQNSDFNSFCMAENESGLSSLSYLQNCYVSDSVNQPIVKSLALIKRILKNGAMRIHGGGFAGCVLCIIKNSELNEFLNKANLFFERKNIIELKVREKGAIVL